jgi:hypothetical protein
MSRLPFIPHKCRCVKPSPCSEQYNQTNTLTANFMPGSVLFGLFCRNALRAMAVAYFDIFALNHNETDVDALNLGC